MSLNDADDSTTVSVSNRIVHCGVPAASGDALSQQHIEPFGFDASRDLRWLWFLEPRDAAPTNGDATDVHRVSYQQSALSPAAGTVVGAGEVFEHLAALACIPPVDSGPGFVILQG